MQITRPRDRDDYVDELYARMPSRLYKYVDLTKPKAMERLRSLLIDSRGYFAPSSSFNDPLDCRIPPQFDGSALAIEHFWKKFVQQHPAIFGNLSKEVRKKRIAELVRNSKTPSGQKKLCERMFKDLDRHGILCLTSHPDSMLMWSYY